MMQRLVHMQVNAKGAPNVFKVVDGQFVIDTSADSEENIRATVANCPSGALKIEE